MHLKVEYEVLWTDSMNAKFFAGQVPVNIQFKILHTFAPGLPKLTFGGLRIWRLTAGKEVEILYRWVYGGTLVVTAFHEVVRWCWI